MQATQDYIPVDSDINQYMSQELHMFDSYTETAFKELKIKSLMTRAKIKKRHGIPVQKLLYDLFHIPFLMFDTVFLFVRNQYESAMVDKSAYYRFLENAKFNWSLFLFHLSFTIHTKMKYNEDRTKFFVIDDTVCEVTGKLIEQVSYVYDHTIGRSVLGFQKLILGVFDGEHFLPIGSKVCVGKTKPVAKSKARKYQKTPKSERVNPESPGALARGELSLTKLEKSLSMLKRARKQFSTVNYVLFDSWFCFNSFIIKIKKQTKLDVICQLKNLPRPNQYIYKEKSYSLAQLYAYFAKHRMRLVKKYGYKRCTLTIMLKKSDLKMKIVFVQKNDEQKWHAFGSTDHLLSAQKILEYYSQRWSIEVFFKNCKQYLNYGKEQVSNLDSIIASDAIVFTRYVVLTYLSFKENSGFYSILETNRKRIRENTYGQRLLNYFLNKLKVVIEMICELIENGNKIQAVKALKSIISDASLINPDFANLK